MSSRRATFIFAAEDGINAIKDAIKDHNLNRVVVASCTPRTHEPLFRDACEEAGLNKFFFEFANIRDQCSWVHMHEWDEATAKARDLVRMSVMRAALLQPLDERSSERTVAERSYRRCFVAGACSLAVPAAGVGTFLFFAFILPSRYSYNPASELLRVIMGIALLLPVPLAVTSLVFFIMGISASRGAGAGSPLEDRHPAGLAAGVAGLAMSAASAGLFVLAASAAPGL